MPRDGIRELETILLLTSRSWNVSSVDQDKELAIARLHAMEARGGVTEIKLHEAATAPGYSYVVFTPVCRHFRATKTGPQSQVPRPRRRPNTSHV